MSSTTILASVKDVLAKYDGASMEVITLMEPGWSDSRHPMVRHLVRNAERFSGRTVVPVLSLGESGECCRWSRVVEVNLWSETISQMSVESHFQSRIDSPYLAQRKHKAPGFVRSLS